MSAPLSVRLRPELQDVLASLGSPHTTARALILIGLAATGADLAAFQRDITLLLAEPLDTKLLGALSALNERGHRVVRAYYAPPENEHRAVLPPPLAMPIGVEDLEFAGWDV